MANNYEIQLYANMPKHTKYAKVGIIKLYSFITMVMR